MSSAENFTHSAKHEIQANRAMRKYMLGRKRIVTMPSRKRLYSFDPLKLHFYIVKLGFTGVYIIFLISAQKHKL